MKFNVSSDGLGDFLTIQEAVDAASPNDEILVSRGIYRERVVINKKGIRLMGENADETVIVYCNNARQVGFDGVAKGTFLSYSMLVCSDNVSVENITVRNDAGDGSSVGQAIALYVSGNMCTFRKMNIEAHQDTLYCGPVNRRVCEDALPYKIPVQTEKENLGDSPETEGHLFFKECTIRGDIDFIFGSYSCWFEQCTLLINKRGGYYTAPNTPEGREYGFVFYRCYLSGDCAPGTGYLGRPWRKGGRTVFLYCRMDSCVSPQGFCDWDETRKVSELLAEYGTSGARSDTRARNKSEKLLSEEEARQYIAIGTTWDRLLQSPQS